MTIGTEFALERLKKAKIFCISPNRVNVCGELDMLCFDKTGTLTEEGVDVMGVMSVNESVQLSPLQASEAAARPRPVARAPGSYFDVGSGGW